MESGRPMTFGSSVSSLGIASSDETKYNFELQKFHNAENKAIIKINGKEYDVAIKLKSGRNTGFSNSQWQKLTYNIEKLFNQTIPTAQAFQQSTITKDAIALTSNGTIFSRKVNDAFKDMNPIVAEPLAIDPRHSNQEYNYGSRTLPPGSAHSNTPYPSSAFYSSSPYELLRASSQTQTQPNINNRLNSFYDDFDSYSGDSASESDSSTTTPPLNRGHTHSTPNFLSPSGPTNQSTAYSPTWPTGSSGQPPVVSTIFDSVSPTTTTTTTTTSVASTPFQTSSIPAAIKPPATTGASLTKPVTTTLSQHTVNPALNPKPAGEDLLNFDDDIESITLALRSNSAAAAPKPERFQAIADLLDTPVDSNPSAAILIPTHSGDRNENAAALPNEGEEKTEEASKALAGSRSDSNEEDEEESTAANPLASQPAKSGWGWGTATRFGLGVMTFGGSEALRFGYNWWTKPNTTEDSTASEQIAEKTGIESDTESTDNETDNESVVDMEKDANSSASETDSSEE